MPQHRWEQDASGDYFYDGNCVCPHSPPIFRVGYDWGLRLAIFDTLDEAKEFVENLDAQS